MNIDPGPLSEQQTRDNADRLIRALEGLDSQNSGWWAVGLMLVPIALLIVALRGQRERYAMEEWWRRAEWALNAAASGNDTLYSYATAMLAVLAQSSVAGPKDKAIFDAVWKASSTKMQDMEILGLIEQLQGGNLHPPRFLSDDDSAIAAQPIRGDYRMLRREILAARLKVVLDEELGRRTSPAVKRLSAMSLPLPKR